MMLRRVLGSLPLLGTFSSVSPGVVKNSQGPQARRRAYSIGLFTRAAEVTPFPGLL